MSRWPLTLEERFWSKVDKAGGACWTWNGTINRYGYGEFAIGKKHYGAHRVAYELSVAPIPAGLEIDHLCRNTRCVNPAHLEPVTPRENQLRSNSVAGINARKTHCIRGHEFSPDNTYISPKSGQRVCRICADVSRRLYLKKRSEATA